MSSLTRVLPQARASGAAGGTILPRPGPRPYPPDEHRVSTGAHRVSTGAVRWCADAVDVAPGAARRLAPVPTSTASSRPSRPPIGEVTPLVRVRSSGDRCPGALRLHEAADGPLARIRVPGGLLRREQVEALASLTQELGDGSLHLTARGNVEIRGVRDAARLETGLAAVDLLPQPRSHERVRNIVASPLTSRGLDLAPLVRALDAAIVARPALAQLSGRFLFGLDAGAGDVRALAPDLAIVVLDTPDGSGLPPTDSTDVPQTDAPARRCRLLVGDSPDGPTLALQDAPRALTAAAEAFLDVRGSAWRLDDLGPRAGTVAAHLRAAVEASVPTVRSEQPTPAADPYADGPAPGVHAVGRPGTVAIVAGLRLGTAPASAWHAVAALLRALGDDATVTTTPWRSLVIPGVPAAHADRASADLAAAGLVTGAHDPWVGIGACTGRPGCASSHTDVHADAALLAQARADGTLRAATIYLSGCDRRCGHPRTPYVDVVAGDDGRYRLGAPTPRPADADPRADVAPALAATAFAAPMAAAALALAATADTGPGSATVTATPVAPTDLAAALAALTPVEAAR